MSSPSPWTALLQSLHSALIDEVTDRHAEPKPILDKPTRQHRFAFPSNKIINLIWIEVSFGDSKGVALIAADSDFAKELGLAPEDLWPILVKRSGPDFLRRQIAPTFGSIKKLQSSDSTPKELVSFTRIVWMPIKLVDGECFFGIAA